MIIKIHSKMHANNSPKSSPLNEQVPHYMRIAIEIRLDPFMPKPEVFLSPVAGDPGPVNCLELFFPVDVDALATWAKNVNFLSGSLGYSVEEPEVTKGFREILKIM